MKQFVYITKRDADGWESGKGSKLKIKNGKYADMVCEIKMDKETVGDGKLWIMQRAAVLKAQYTKRDMIEREEIKNAEYVENGEIVEIVVVYMDENMRTETKQCKVHVNGNYSDAGWFEEIAE